MLEKGSKCRGDDPSLTGMSVDFSVRVHGDFHRLRDAEGRGPVQPGFLLRYRSAGGNSSDVCCQDENIG